MSFSTDFLSNYTPEEQESQIIKIYAAQGDAADLALAEEAQKIINSGTELLNFPESRLRSWLAALLQKVDNRISAEGTMTVTNDGDDSVVLPKGALISTESGSLYTQITDDTLLAPGDTVSVQIRQGEAAVTTGYYSEYIKVAGEDLDLSNITVEIAGTPIQPCITSNGNVMPIDGYFAFYYDSQLFVKVYPGDHTPYPSGSYFRIVAWRSDGTLGNIGMNTIVGYVDEMHQQDGLLASLRYSNKAITNGIDAPTKADLVNKLRYWFFVKDCVSSVPEYTLWFKNQPEVGDVIVEGDYERALKNPSGVQQITGAVYIAALDRSGNPITDAAWSTLVQRLNPMKDIAPLYRTNPVATYCFIEFKFVTASNIESFLDLLSNVVNNYFSAAWLKEQGLSLFDDLDFEAFRNTLGYTYNQTGFEIIPYHVAEYAISSDEQALTVELPYVGDSGNGKLIVYRNNEAVMELTQQLLPTGEINIYDAGGNIIGYVENNVLLVTYPSPFLHGDVIRCMWEIANPGILPVGQSYGYRQLIGYHVSQVVERS